MYYEAFHAGVEPGGLTNTTDIGILICYILTRIEKPFSGEELAQMIQTNGIANYFETKAAISELIKCKNIFYTDKNEDTIEITENGRLISQQLSSSISISIRQKTINLMMQLLERKKLEKENPVTISKSANGGFDVNIRITDGLRDLMSLTLFVPELSDANAVRDNFYSDPQALYSTILAAAMKDDKLKQTILEKDFQYE